MTTDHTLFQLFPTTVLQTNIGRNLSEKESDFVMKHRDLVRLNTFNTTSNDSFILENDEMDEIKQFCLTSVDKYFHDVFKVKDTCKLYITQSWLNFTEKTQAHHGHLHFNSVLSGVFYSHTDDEDKLYFTSRQERMKPFQFPISEDNYENAMVWWVPAKKGSLYIFPSDLWHHVEVKNSDDVRISLSFNTFVKGELGFEEKLTHLSL